MVVPHEVAVRVLQTSLFSHTRNEWQFLHLYQDILGISAEQSEKNHYFEGAYYLQSPPPPGFPLPRRSRSPMRNSPPKRGRFSPPPKRDLDRKKDDPLYGPKLPPGGRRGDLDFDKTAFQGPDDPIYNPSELKKITIDIHRNLPRSTSPIIRRIINAEDVHIVRRSGEGARPIFDRDEIRHGNAKFDEIGRDGGFEPGAGGGDRGGPDSGFNRPRSSSATRSGRDFERRPRDQSFGDRRSKPRDSEYERRGGGSDLRLELEMRRRDEPNYPAYREEPLPRPEGRDYRSDVDRNADLRQQIIEKRVDRPRSLERDVRERLNERRGVPQQSSYPPDHRRDYDSGKMGIPGQVANLPPRGEGGPHRDTLPPPFRQDPIPVSDFSQRQDHYPVKDWNAGSEFGDKRSFFEHDMRDGDVRYSTSSASRGTLGGKSSPRGRGRGFNRGMQKFRPPPIRRPKGASMRRRGPSPRQWTHDKFESASLGNLAHPGLK